MSTTTTTTTGRSFSLAGAVAMLLGGLIFGYGLLLVPASVLGGVHIAAIGLSMLLAGLFTTEWAGQRFGLTDARRGRLSLTFAGLALVLMAAFVALNFASFEAGSASGGEQSG